ncbi:MAG: KH domain-containing protein [Ruminococcaceae bacterium]|nr:KH domain-containing protein [Oscillospiraceae bacterium]
MIKEAFGEGLTVEEAKENAVLTLNARSDDDVMFDVVEMPKQKVLGLFGGKLAKVRAYVELPDEKPARKPKADKNDRKKKNDKPQKKAKNNAPIDDKNQASKEYENAVPAEEIEKDSPAGRAVAYVSNIIGHLGCKNVEIKVAPRENGAVLILSGDGLGVVIGRRGETLDSLQYLASLAANSGNGYFKVSLDIGNYRERREKTLISLAKRVSAQVISTSRSKSLEPMNPYERRIIHTAVQEIEGVTSGSVGEGSSRRVVISPVKGATKKVEEAPARAPKKDAENAPLYGKIN